MPKRNLGQQKYESRNQGRATDRENQQQGSFRETVQEGVGAMSEQFHDTMETVQNGMTAGYRRAENIVARNPAPSVLLCFGVGFGLGLVLTSILSRPEESWSEWTSRRAREAMSHARDTTRHAEDAARELPDTFHHLTETIRHLPEAIARHLPSVLTRRA